MREFSYTRKINQRKHLTELPAVLLLFLLYIVVWPFMVLKAKISKKDLYVPLKNAHSLKLDTFNTSSKFIKYLPLSRDVLRKKVFFVGTDIYENITHMDTMPGLISLYSLRALMGIDHLSAEDTDYEYLQHTSTLYDIKLSIRFLLASLFSSRRKVYLPRLKVMGVAFLNTTMESAVELIRTQVHNRQKSKMYFINADTLNKTYDHVSLRKILNHTPFVFPDGSGVKKVCSLMNMPMKQNVNGTDMFPFICKMAEKEGMKIFLYGAKEGVAKRMKEKVLQEFPDLQIVAAINGYDLHDNEVINMINYSEADIVFVAKGAPLQEEWIDTHSKQISAPVVIGVGGLFDFYSGNVSRAPIWMREIGIEWIYRLLQEPKRMWKRYIVGNIQFLIRAYFWDRSQKQKKMKKYYKTVASKSSSSFLPDMSFIGHRLYPVLKRIMDVFITSIAVLLLSPLMIVVAILIKLESKGPVFFSQKRVGQDGKLFNMHKFRSMVINAEELKAELAEINESEDGVIFKMKDDPRITKVGKFIRKWSIDELPQLFNVIMGDMSLVGPRPPVPSEVDEYITDDLKRLHTMPGITCYWQIAGRSEIPFKQQVDLDKKYISTASLWTDIKILLATVPAVLA